MIYLNLSCEEALDLFENLIKSDKHKLAFQLKKELIKVLSSLDENQNRRNLELATAWIKKQQAILVEKQEEKNVSKQ